MQATQILEANVETKSNKLAALTGRFELVIADPDPLGIFGFAFATFLANLSTLGVYSFNAMWLSTMIFLGGLAELIAGIQDYKRNNIFGATVFSFFGVGWMGNAITAWLVTLKIVPATDPISQGWSCLFWAVFVAAMTGASLKLTKVLTVILVLVTSLELLLAIGSFTGVMFITHFYRVWSIVRWTSGPARNAELMLAQHCSRKHR